MQKKPTENAVVGSRKLTNGNFDLQILSMVGTEKCIISRAYFLSILLLLIGKQVPVWQ
jgi:hypothetical protein